MLMWNITKNKTCLKCLIKISANRCFLKTTSLDLKESKISVNKVESLSVL